MRLAKGIVDFRVYALIIDTCAYGLQTKPAARPRGEFMRLVKCYGVADIAKPQLNHDSPARLGNANKTAAVDACVAGDRGSQGIRVPERAGALYGLAGQGSACRYFRTGTICPKCCWDNVSFECGKELAFQLCRQDIGRMSDEVDNVRSGSKAADLVLNP